MFSGAEAAEMIAISSTRFADQTVYWLTTAYLLTYTLVFSEVTAGNEDGDQIYMSKSQKNLAEMGLRQLEGPNGIPVSIDGLFLQISGSQDDLGQVGSTECLHGSHLSELDMCITPSQADLFESQSHHPGIRNRRQASANGFSLWKNGIVPYVFNSTFPAQDRDAILGAMSEWEKATCIRFRLATVHDIDIVVFRDGRRCSTNIGRIGREQVVTLAKSCRSKRILIHELGHVIGLIHEHQRHDRDKYVRVILENVRNMSQERYQFSKLLSGSITDKTVKYDYTSVMHYGRNYFAKSPELTTLQTTDGRYQDIIGRAERPSFSDIETVNRLYHCSAGCNQYLQCSDSCYLDNTCTCRCAPVMVEKPLHTGPSPHRNTLPDSTCDYFASRGECNGNIKETVKSLCAKSCGLLLVKLNSQQQQQHQPWPHHATAAAIAPTQTKSNWDQAQPDPLSHGAAARSAVGHRNNDINVVSDIPMVLNGDAIVPAVAVQSGVASLQAQQTSLSGHQTYLQNYNFAPVANVHSHYGNEVNHQQASPGQAATYLREALLQKPASSGPDASNLLRSLILSRTEPASGRISTAPDQANSYTEYGGSTKPPIKTSLNSNVHVVQPIRSPLSSNWLHQPSMQYQILQRQQLAQQLSMQQRQNYLLYQQSRLNNHQGHLSHSSHYAHHGNTDALQREIMLNRQSRVNNMQNHAHNVRHNLNHNAYQETTFGQILQKSRENVHESQMMQTAGVERGGATSPLADFTGANLGTDLNTNVDPPPDNNRNLQTIGPSFMKSGNVPPDFMPSEIVSPLGSPVEQINVDVPGRPALEQQQLTSVYFSGSPQQSFEPAFSLTDPARSQRWPTGMSVWESIIQRINRQQSSLNSGPTVDTPSQPVASIDQISFTNGMVSQTVSPQNSASLETIPNLNVDGNINQQNQQQWLRAQQLQPQIIPDNAPVHHLFNTQLSLTDPNQQTLLPGIPSMNSSGSWFANDIISSLSVEQMLSKNAASSKMYLALSNRPSQESAIMTNHHSSGNIPPRHLMLSINSENLQQGSGSLIRPSDTKLNDMSSFFPIQHFINNYTYWNGGAQHYKYFQLFPTKTSDNNKTSSSTWPIYRGHDSPQFETSQPSHSMQSNVNSQYQQSIQVGSTGQFS